MSIKKLFDSVEDGRKYLSSRDQKDAFKDVESERNLEQLKKKQSTLVPQVDYSNPRAFARFGSAYYYYKGGMERITDYYPYDGSDAEINEFYNKLLDVEKYIFNNLYPRTNGYVKLGEATTAAVSNVLGGYSVPSTKEYITLKGGPHGVSSTATLAEASNNPYSDKFQYSNVYDTSIYTTAGFPSDYGVGTRQSNLQTNFDTGVTIEFWLKKPNFMAAGTAGNKETIFDLWTSGSHSGSGDYGRITLELTGGVDGSPFLLTAQSGAAAPYTTALFQQSIGENLTTASLSTWNHFAFVLYSTEADFRSQLYVNGAINDTVETARIPGQLKQKNMFARIGSLLAAPSGSAVGGVLCTQFDGISKLSASMDEFRFWKEKRDAEDIGRYWFTQVRGGTNTDISNTTLGIYYKFNEGITGTDSIDSGVLDYSGRISNGAWTGYGTNSRNSNSAILEASASIKEYKDPIIYAVHPSVSNLKAGLLESGSYHDSQNNALFKNYAPSWIIEEHEEIGNKNLDLISHIAGTYFDKVYLLSKQIPKLKGINYTSASSEPVPFARHLPQSLGLYTPEIFIDANVMESFLNRTEDRVFEDDLNETKNLIYLNLYNNLANIYKSKGTEKSLRNVLRCFNVDEKLVKINTYANNTTFPLNNNYEQLIENKKYANFNKAENRGANIYQRIDSSNANSSGYISSSNNTSVHRARAGYEREYGATIEADVLLPHWNKIADESDREYTTVSLFGLTTPESSSAAGRNGTDTSANNSGDFANFQVHAVKLAKDSKSVYFELTSSGAPAALPKLTSSIFFDVYDNTTWNLSVRVKPRIDAPTTQLTGASITTYDVIFEGRNTNLGGIQSKFAVSGTVNALTGSNFLVAPKRLYIGAERTNLTGALVNKSDVLISSARYWTKYLKDGTLAQHGYDIDNYGISGSYQNVSPLDSSNYTLDILNLNTLALNWSFNQITSSNSTGNFVVNDGSSGSIQLRNNYGTMGAIAGYQHTGYGNAFATSNSDVVKKRQVNTFKFIEPERATSADAVQILSEDDKVFGVVETVPSYVYTVEKSMYRAISEEMLDFFAGVVDFNNIIGEPVNRYRDRYKAMEKLREAFFRKVTKTSQVEKFVEYYKWFDDAISHIMGQLVPASSEFVSDVYNTVESHALERNKYQTQFPTLEGKPSSPNAAVQGIGGMGVTYRDFRSPLSASLRPTNKDIAYWFKKAKRSDTEISSGDPTIDSQRETYRIVINSEPRLIEKFDTLATPAGVTYKQDFYPQRNFQKLYDLKIDKVNERFIHGGTNFESGKNIQFTLNALYPFGPINTDGGRFIPLNVLLGLTQDLVSIQDFLDNRELRKKVKRVIRVQHGRDWQNGQGYNTVKSTMAFPFNIMSSSVKSGYNKEVIERVGANIEITNLHNDVYGAAMDIPMQGPFTEQYVGGHQSRHIALNTGSDNYTNRPEAWKLLLGQCPKTDVVPVVGAIGMASPTYPYPNTHFTPPSSSYGLVDFTANPSFENFITIGDGDSNLKFELPFGNSKGLLFGPFDGQNVWLTVGGNQSASLDSSNKISPYYCFDLAGAGDIEQYGCPGTPDFYEGATQTWTAWISQSATDAGYIFQTGDPHAGVNFITRTNDKLRCNMRWYDGAGTSTTSVYWETDNAVLTPGTWQHVALTFDATLTGSTIAAFFVDGVQVDASLAGTIPTSGTPRLQIQRYADGTLPSTPGCTDYNGAATPCNSQRIYTTIGASSNAGTSFTGSIDEMSVWDMSMSADQISELYATGSVKDLFQHSVYLLESKNLHSWWRMGDSDQDAVDGTGTYSSDNRILDVAKKAEYGSYNYGFPAANVAAFTTDVVTGSKVVGSIPWERGGTANATAVNLVSAVNTVTTTFNITASGPEGVTETITVSNTKYGVPGTTKKLARGTIGNVAMTKDGSNITVDGMKGGLDPQFINYDAPRATYYREELAKRPVNIRNIKMTTGSTVIGNYEHNYQVVNTVGAFANPRSFVQDQPTLPSVITSNTNLNRGGADRFQGPSSEVVLNYLTRNENSASYGGGTSAHHDYGLDYGVTDNSGAFENKSIIISRFGAPGSRETMARGFQDFRSSEFSVYNTLNYRNLSVLEAGTNKNNAQLTGSGYMVTDIHSRPFGLYQHLTRHSARFGRDSLNPVTPYPVNLSGTVFYPVNTLSPLVATPSYIGGEINKDIAYTSEDDLQAWWVFNEDKSSSGTVADSSGNGMTGSFNADSRPSRFSDSRAQAPTSQIVRFLFVGADPNKMNLGTALEWNAKIGNSGSSEVTLAGWFKIDWSKGHATYPTLFDFGLGASDTGHMVMYYYKSVDRLYFITDVKDTDTSANSSEPWYWTSTTCGRNLGWGVDIEPAWVHLAITFDGAEATESNAAKLYVNGQLMALTGEPTYPASFEWNGFNGGNCYLASWANLNYPGHFDIADLAIWSKVLPHSEIKALYLAKNGVYRQSELDVVQPGAVYDQLPSFHKTNRNQRKVIKVIKDVGNTPQSQGYVTSSQRDNYWVQHPIPRSDRQYLWITSSLLSEKDHFGYLPANYLVSSSTGYEEPYAFVSASDFGAVNYSSFYPYLWGLTKAHQKQLYGATPGYRQLLVTDFVGMNLIIAEPVSASTNTIGYPLRTGVDGQTNQPTPLYTDRVNPVSEYQYVNRGGHGVSRPPGSISNRWTGVSDPTSTDGRASAYAFNALMLHRNGPYGWPSWKQIRYDNPVTRNEYALNRLSVYTPGQGTNGTDFKTFDLSPVSLRGRTAKVNVDGPGGEDTTFIVSHNNMEIFFKDDELNDMVGIDYDEISTGLEQLIDITRDNPKYSPNWILYSQNIFPSERNEMLSYISTRTGYDNKYWRATIGERVDVGATLNNSFGIPGRQLSSLPKLPSQKNGPLVLTQSSWPLDAPVDFLTRVAYGTNNSQGQQPFPIDFVMWNSLRNIEVGELQNYYTFGPRWPKMITLGDYNIRQPFHSPGALYARKQTLGSPNSVASPTGLPANVGSLTGTFDGQQQIEPFAGEAVWEAPLQAGYIIKTGSKSTFVSHSSEPWFSNYDDFRHDLKLMAKGYSIVPEFRISEHVSDFQKYGLFGQQNSDIFEIPGTGINSANEKEFYLDYSNSEFLKGFLNIKENSLLNATEIKLECEAALRFNPYKGFYPAQRSLDLVSQFSSSYFNSITALQGPTINPYTGEAYPVTASAGTNILYTYGGATRPLLNTLFAPGILYNSIKSGIAVDYPILLNNNLIDRFAAGTGSNWWAAAGGSTWDAEIPHRIGYNGLTSSYAIALRPPFKRGAADIAGYDGQNLWDLRIPFDGIITPEKYLLNLPLVDMESNNSCSLPLVTASLTENPGDNLYSLMASNYFAEVGNFFLKGAGYTKLKSRVVSDNLTFESGSVYAARIKLRRSMSGSREYEKEKDWTGATGSLNSFYSKYGARAPNYYSASVATDGFAGWVVATASYGTSGIAFISGASIPLPQDPRFAQGYRETFTLYSRPTAFGPPISAKRASGSDDWTVTLLGYDDFDLEDKYSIMDSYNGYNWAYTPPYTNGESWADVVFRPNAEKTYDVAQILAEADVHYWRYDPGMNTYKTSSVQPTNYIGAPLTNGNPLGYNFHYVLNTQLGLSWNGPYDAPAINANAMQLSASINLFGVEKEQFIEEDAFSAISTTRNTSVGSRWIIQPKFETPHPNFNQATASMPVYGSASVPVGMWHQFGTIPDDPNTGIFLEINDIPEAWLKYHSAVAIEPSIYNNYNEDVNPYRYRHFKSLTNVLGFESQGAKKRLGEIADSQVLREAIVAVPYIIEEVEGAPLRSILATIGAAGLGAPIVSNEKTKYRKKFIDIPKERFNAALRDQVGSFEGDSLEAAGESIRKLVQKMERYVLPPQFDFLGNTNIDPIAMYMFEFEYKLDKNDLNYIWQNLAPRNYKQITFQKSSIAHELMDTELLSQANVMDNENLRWMVFKVKQKSQKTYDEMLVSQADAASSDAFLQPTPPQQGDYKIMYNWPYDYVSFVEMIKIDAQVLYGGRSTGTPGQRLSIGTQTSSPLLESPLLTIGLPTPTVGGVGPVIGPPPIPGVASAQAPTMPVMGPPPITAATTAATPVMAPPPVITSVTAPTAVTRAPRISTANRSRRRTRGPRRNRGRGY